MAATHTKGEDLLEAVLALRGATDDDTFRICSQGKKSFLEASRQSYRIRQRVEMRGGHFDALLPFSVFEKTARLLRGEVVIDHKDETLLLRNANKEISLRSGSTEEWVASPEWKAPKQVASLAGGIFRKSLEQAIRAVSTDPGRPLLGSVALSDYDGQMHFVATDSYRLLALPLPGDLEGTLPKPLLLQRPLARAIQKDLQRTRPEEVWIEWAEEEGASGGIISYGGASWYVQSPEGEYPAWRDLLEREGDKLQLPRESLHNLLLFVEALGGKSRPEQNGAAALRLELGDRVRVRFERPGLGEIEESLQGASWTGASETLGMNPLFVKDMLEVLEGETLLGQRSRESGGFVFAGRGDARYLLMPIRLAEL